MKSGKDRRRGMKTLLLIRHAKSSWDDAALPDKDRPLEDRGKRDAT
jgi:phosphohistidine phosphatase